MVLISKFFRFPLDGAVELHFSPSPTPRQPAPAPTPAVPVESADDPVVRWDSYADIHLERDADSETDDNGEFHFQVSYENALFY